MTYHRAERRKHRTDQGTWTTADGSEPHLRPDIAAVLGLQRRIGNGALVRLLSGREATPAHPVAVQRLGTTPASDAVLANHYNTMVAGSPTFADLNRKVTTNANITLTDSTATQDVDYNSGTHTIRVPLLTAVGGPAHPVTQIRERLLWEMHNASNSGPLGRAWARDPSAPTTAEEKSLFAARKAAAALAVEWTEWMMIVEHDLRAGQIDTDLGGTAVAPAIDRMFNPEFAVPDAGWFRFSNYLRTQVQTGHTASYDPAALAGPGGRDWKGWKMLAVVEKSAPAVVQITQKQVADWTSGARVRMKSPGNNPFASDAIAREVG